MRITIGIDIGQRVDPTAIAVCEHIWREANDGVGFVDHDVIRHLERLPLGTAYPVVRDRLMDLITMVQERVQAGTLKNNAGWLEPEDFAVIKVYIDATGVGQPVVDMMREKGAKVTGVYFTHGDRRIVQTDEQTGELRVMLGKAYMVSRLQARLQARRIHLPETPEARQLARELQDYEIRVSEKGNETAGAFKVGTHDDLVTAIGLCVQTPVKRVAGVASTMGHKPLPAPQWAGGPPTRTNTRQQPTTRLKGLDAWGADDPFDTGR